MHTQTHTQTHTHTHTHTHKHTKMLTHLHREGEKHTEAHTHLRGKDTHKHTNIHTHTHTHTSYYYQCFSVLIVCLQNTFLVGASMHSFLLLLLLLRPPPRPPLRLSPAFRISRDALGGGFPTFSFWPISFFQHFLHLPYWIFLRPLVSCDPGVHGSVKRDLV